MRPRNAYRTATVLAIVAPILLVVGLVAQDWWFAATMAFATAGGILGRRDWKRRGVDWHGPKTWRELRKL